MFWSWGSAVSIVIGYGVNNRGVGVRVPVDEELSLLHIVQTGLGQPSLLYNGNRGLFPGGNAVGA
jgi:hypothetical protein